MLIGGGKGMDLEDELRKKCLVIQHLTDSALRELIRVSTLKHVGRSDVVVRAGDAIEEAFVLLEGSVNAVCLDLNGRKKVLEHASQGYLLAEAELLDEVSYQCDLIAQEDSLLLSIPFAQYMHILALKDAVIGDLSSYSRPKTYRLLVMRYLSSLFRSGQHDAKHGKDNRLLEQEWLAFEEQALDELVDSIEWVNLDRGEYLFHQGDTADGAYMLVSGVMSVTLAAEDTEQEVDRVMHGEIIGEMALVADEDRSANVVAIRNCELFRIPVEHFRRIADRYPRLMFNIYRTISERFIRSRSQAPYRPKKTNIALLTIGQTEDSEELVESLQRALAKLGRIQLLSRDTVDHQLATPGIADVDASAAANLGLMRWLNSREKLSDYVIYRAGQGWGNWTWRCVTQADELVVIADTEHSCDFTDLLQKVRKTNQQWSLVLLHPGNLDRPRKTAQWVQDAAAERVFHVRKRHSGDVGRLARILGGKANSLVLGGGGARGFAHIGVIKALQELGVPIDMIGGSSIGAPIAVLVAQGYSPDKVQELTAELFKRLIDWTLPLTSMLRGKRIAETIQTQTNDWDIEDFWIPFFCVSTNLTRAHEVVHKRGNSAVACRASVSIPGILPPVPLNGDLLVDGGVLNNLPISVMREMNPSGRILAFDVVPVNGTRAKQDYGMELSGWRVLLRSLNPFEKKIKSPAIGAVIMQSVILGSSIARKRDLKLGAADYYQNIQVNKVGLLDFDKVEPVAKLGYEACIEPIRDWLEQEQKNHRGDATLD